jgi:phosphoribosylformimino-5-aminoimidazole carboxamide ribotide isomerase
LILYPAIDLKAGHCVRLVRGDMGRETRFNADPADQARRFEQAGFEWLHVVDLDGAVAGRAVNERAVAAIIAAVRMPVQLGGGIRDMARIQHWLASGISRVILGTVAITNPALVREACRRFPRRIAVGIDARAGRVATEGWATTTESTAADVARAMAHAGVAAIIYTDIERDGMMSGVNIAATAALARSVPVPVIASGGVSSLDDIAALRAQRESGIAGAIIGRALYEGALDARAALAVARGELPC